MNPQRATVSRLGVRARTTIIATVAVGLVLAGSSVLLIAATRSALFRSVKTTVTARSADLASQIGAGPLPASVPLVGGISVQVLVDGVVVSSTADIEGQSPILNPAQLSGAMTLVQVGSLDAAENASQGQGGEGDDGPFLVAVSSVRFGESQATVLAAGSLVAVESATRTLIPLLALGVPAIALLVALTVWRLTRRAFQPVEAMAERADAISYTDLHLRIPEPAPDDEIRRLAVVLNRMLERLETSVSRQRRFTSDAGHELKSPVTTLLTMAEVAEANPDAFTVTELASDYVAQSRRLAALVEDLLVLARTDEHRMALDRARFDLADVIREEVSGSGHVPVSFDTELMESVPVFGDRRRMGQVMRNLLDNATQHAAHIVRIETTATRESVIIRVADDGPGIPEVDRERVFERFVRLDEARSRETGGTGLGLPVVRSILEAHGGRVSIGGDTILGGALVTILLPSGLNEDLVGSSMD